MLVSSIKKIKVFILSLIGLWGKRYQYSWRVTRSVSKDDRVGALFKSTLLPDGSLELFTRTETLTNVSMLPIHLIALNMEHVFLAKAIGSCRALSLGIRGIRVDCVYPDARKKKREAVLAQLDDYDDWPEVSLRELYYQTSGEKEAK